MSCPICFDEFINIDTDNKTDQEKKELIKKNIIKDTVTLECGHTFHYECLEDWFKNNISKHRYNFSKIRVCPYCRTKSGYLKLPYKTFPIKHIHKEYEQIETCFNCNDQKKIIEHCSQFINNDKCNYILYNTSSHLIKQCKKNKSKNHDFCHIHLKKMGQ